MNEELIALEITFDARPDDVFMALTHPDLIQQWSGQEAVFVQKVGGEFAMFDRWVTGQVLDFKPPRLVSYSWQVKDWQEGAADSLVTISLEGQGKQTQVTLIHRGFPNEEEKESHRTGWMENVFDPVKTFLERRNKKPRATKKDAVKKAGKKKPAKKGTGKKPVKKGVGKKPMKKGTGKKRKRRK